MAKNSLLVIRSLSVAFQLSLATIVGLGLSATPSTSVANGACATLFKSAEPGKNLVPYSRIRPVIAGVQREITFIHPDSFELYRAQVQSQNQVELRYDRTRNGTVAEKHSVLVDKFWQGVVRSVFNRFGKGHLVRPFLHFENRGPVLTSARILEIAETIRAKQIDPRHKGFIIQIGETRPMQSEEFLQVVAAAKQNPSSLRIDLAELVNTSASGKTANLLFSTQQILKRYGWSISILSYPLAKAFGIEIEPVLETGLVYIGTSYFASIVGSIGAAKSAKLAYILPNISAWSDARASRALALNAAKHGAVTIQKLAENDANLRDIVIVTDIADFRSELQTLVSSPSKFSRP